MSHTTCAFTNTLVIPGTSPKCVPHVSSWRMRTTEQPRPTKSNVLSRLTELNTRVQTIKCPFWRRRFTDSVEAAAQVATWAIRTRHKSLPLPLPLPLLLPAAATSAARKSENLTMAQRVAVLRDDFEKRQYYVTGRLTSRLYCDDCLFDGPDPDGRVRGVRKFCNAAAGLFDTRLSRIDLVHIGASVDGTVIAEWRLQGALKLPWRPRIKPYVGSTVYSFDERGLVCTHVETWRISVVDAFLSVVWKGFGAPPAPPIEELRAERRKANVGNCAQLGEMNESEVEV